MPLFEKPEVVNHLILDFPADEQAPNLFARSVTIRAGLNPLPGSQMRCFHSVVDSLACPYASR